MTALEELDAWIVEQRANHGLVDIKFFPGEPGDETGPEAIAAFTLRLIRGEIPCTDITGDLL